MTGVISSYSTPSRALPSSRGAGKLLSFKVMFAISGIVSVKEGAILLALLRISLAQLWNKRSHTT